QLAVARCELGVDRRELLVQRAQLLARSLQLALDRLELLVGGCAVGPGERELLGPVVQAGTHRVQSGLQPFDRGVAADDHGCGGTTAADPRNPECSPLVWSVAYTVTDLRAGVEHGYPDRVTAGRARGRDRSDRGEGARA